MRTQSAPSRNRRLNASHYGAALGGPGPVLAPNKVKAGELPPWQPTTTNRVLLQLVMCCDKVRHTGNIFYPHFLGGVDWARSRPIQQDSHCVQFILVQEVCQFPHRCAKMARGTETRSVRQPCSTPPKQRRKGGRLILENMSPYSPTRLV